MMPTATKKITKINVKNIPCYVSIGVADEEKKMGQQLLVDVELSIDSAKVAETDSLKNTVSYTDIYKIVQTISQSKSYSLIETMAEELACTLLKNDIANEVKITVYKPHIPYKEFQGNVSVEVKRTK